MKQDVENRLWNWFGLSYASWLTVPRVLLHEMPIEWQNKLADLLYEYDEVFTSRPDIQTRVQAVCNGKITKFPEWLLNYRHPVQSEIDKLKG